MAGPKKSRKRHGIPPLKSILEPLAYYIEVSRAAASVTNTLTERYAGPELEAVLRIFLSAIARKLYEVQEWDHESKTTNPERGRSSG